LIKRFEKNPALRPVLTETSLDTKSFLESNLINVKIEHPKEEINKIMNNTQQKRQSILEHTNAELKKLQNSNIVVENFRPVSNPINDHSNNTINNMINGINISEVINSNEILKIEINELKYRYDKCDQENKNIKIENIKLKENLSKQNNMLNESEFFKLKEELDKYKIINKDRIDLLAQIEEKNSEILELKMKLNGFENEYELIKRNTIQSSSKISELENLILNYENMINEMKNKIDELIKEKNELTVFNQNKIEILQGKLFNFDSESLAENEEKKNNQNIMKILEMVYENLNEFENLFNKNVQNLEKNLNQIKDYSEKTEKKFTELIEERNNHILEIFENTKNSISQEIVKFHNKSDDENKNNKINERIEWMKKQVNELMNYKLKSTNLEENLKKIESHNKKLEEMMELCKYNSLMLEKVNSEKEEKIVTKDKYIRNLEARLSDVKDFMFSNHIDKIEDMNKWYKF